MGPTDCFEQGAVALARRQYETAADLARRGLMVDPDDGRLWQLAGCAAWGKDDFATARDALETASLLRPLSPLARLALAESYVACGQSDLARIIYLYLAEPDRCPPELQPRLARGLGALREHQVALAVCRALVAIRPGYHSAWYGIAFYLVRLGGPPGGVAEALRRAMELAPQVLRYRLELAWVLDSWGQRSEAAEVLAEVDPSRVSCPVWLSLLQQLFERHGNRQRAEECRQYLTALVPHS